MQVAGLLALTAVGIIMGSLVLLGIPGALWLMIANPLAGLFTAQRAPADSAWPMAIAHSLIWPVFLPLAYLLATRLAAPGRPRAYLTMGLTALAALAMAVVFEAWAGRVS